MRWREANGVRWLEASLPGAHVAFCARLGGASAAPYDSLNLGALTDDEPAAVAENRRRLYAALNLNPQRIAFAHQVHGAELATHTAANPALGGSLCSDGEDQELGKPGRGSGEADGHVLAEPGVAALVLVADCLPVAIVGPGGVALLHCGWRGLNAGIVAAGAEAVGATHAAIGPGIGPCCYEVGEEVLSAFSGLGEGIADGRMLDLSAVARRLLAAAGVTEVESAGICTSCEPGLFFSHRRDAGRTGRQAALAWLDPDGS